MTTKVRESTLDVPLTPGVIGVIGGPLVLVNTANTVNLSTLSDTTQNISFTGSVTIAGFQILDGQTYICKAMSEFRILTGASIATPTSKDISVRTGDSFIIRAVATNVVQILCYSRFSAPNITQSASCRLDLDSGSGNLVLSRFNGVTIPINGINEIIPGATVTLAPTGLTPDTIYYIYAYMSGANMLLEASTTGHTKSTITGVEIKIADATRTLVGMVRPVTGPIFADSLEQRFVVSWYNTKPAAMSANLSSDVVIAGTYPVVPVPLSTEVTVEFIAFADRRLTCTAIAPTSNDTATAVTYTSIGLLGSPVGASAIQTTVAATVGVINSVTQAFSGTTFEGYYSASICGAATLGSDTTWYADPSTYLQVIVEI